MNIFCPVENRATRPSIVPALAGHEIQPQQAVGESRTIEAAVKMFKENISRDESDVEKELIYNLKELIYNLQTNFYKGRPHEDCNNMELLKFVLFSPDLRDYIKKRDGLMTKSEAIASDEIGALWAEKMAEDDEIYLLCRREYLDCRNGLRAVARLLRERAKKEEKV